MAFQLAFKKQWPIIPRKEVLGLILYTVTSFSSTACMYIGASLLPLSTMQCISTTSTIISGIFLFLLCLKEKPTVLVFVSALVCICGVTLVIQPEVLFR